MKNMIRIFLADDHAIVRDGIRLILNNEDNLEVVGESGDGKEALGLIEKLKPDIAVLDISMPTMSGIEMSRYLHKYVPETKILILSRHDNEAYVNKLLDYNINGYVLKDDAGNDLIRAIDEIMKGNMYLSPKIATSILNDYIAIKHEGQNIQNAETTSPYDVLTSRERQILKLIAEGNDNNQISKIIRVSPKTVKTHRANIMRKLNIHKVNDLVTYAIKNGFVEV